MKLLKKGRPIDNINGWSIFESAKGGGGLKSFSAFSLFPLYIFFL